MQTNILAQKRGKQTFGKEVKICPETWMGFTVPVSTSHLKHLVSTKRIKLKSGSSSCENYLTILREAIVRIISNYLLPFNCLLQLHLIPPFIHLSH